MLKVILPDGNALEFSHRVRPLDVAAEIGPRLAKATIAAEVDGQLVGADALLPAEGGVSLRLITTKDPQALEILRHSCADVMARAVMRLFPGVQLAFGPTVDNGFYYDFQSEEPLRKRTFRGSRRKWPASSRKTSPSSAWNWTRAEALAICRDLGQSLKVEHLEEGLAGETTVSFYRQGEFVDLCRGPHVPRAARSGPSNSSPSPAPIGRATPGDSSCSGSMAPPCSTSRTSTPT